MRVAIDATFLGTGRGGDETFLRGVLRGLPAAANRTRSSRCCSARGPCRRRSRATPASPSSAWRRAPEPGISPPACPCATPGATGPGHDGDPCPLTGRVPFAVTVGDLSFWHRPQDYPRTTAARLRILVPRHLSQARVVLTPSAYSRSPTC